ncbi:MAG: type 4a pilus biogenesis protein PilO [Thermodesulfobacteriota bacterium]
MALKDKLDSIIKLSTPKKIVLLAAVNFVVAVGIYWFLTGPKKMEVRSLSNDMQRLSAKLEENRRAASDLPKFMQEKKEMEQKLADAVARLPNEKEIPDLIDAISSAAKKSGLKILLFRPAREVNKGFYADLPINMSVEGRFESLFDFSAKVGNLPRIVNLTFMDITSMGHKKRVPGLKADFVATTFRFIPGALEVTEKK